MLSTLKYIQNVLNRAATRSMSAFKQLNEEVLTQLTHDAPRSMRFVVSWLFFSMPTLLTFVFYEILVRPLFLEFRSAYTFLILILVLALLPIFLILNFASIIPVYILTYPLIHAKRLLKRYSERPRWAGFLVKFASSIAHAAAALVIAAFVYQVVHFWFVGSLDAATMKLTSFTLLILFATYFVMVLRLKRGDFGFYRGDITLVLLPKVVTYSKRKNGENSKQKKGESAPTAVAGPEFAKKRQANRKAG